MSLKEKKLERYKSCTPRHFSRWRFYFHLFALRFIFRPVLVLARRPKVYGQENVPRGGPFIVVSNHIDTFDPIQISHAVDYPIAYVAKKELFGNLPMAEFYRFMGCFALDRERPGGASLKSAFNVLRSRAGWALGMFPEGTRSHTNELLPLKKGVGSIAQKTRLPILPVGIQKNVEGRFILIIGKLIRDVSDAEATHRKVSEALVSLTDPALGREAMASGGRGFAKAG
jgi:1-acyl-sn-glycerol-3-phosphate acyltransferase